MKLRTGDEFTGALALQRVTREAMWKTSNIHTRRRLEGEYENVTCAINEYVETMNSHGEQDDYRD